MTSNSRLYTPNSQYDVISLTSGPGLPLRPSGPGGPFIASYKTKHRVMRVMSQTATQCVWVCLRCDFNISNVHIPWSAAGWPEPEPPVQKPQYLTSDHRLTGTAHTETHKCIRGFLVKLNTPPSGQYVALLLKSCIKRSRWVKVIIWKM